MFVFVFVFADSIFSVEQLTARTFMLFKRITSQDVIDHTELKANANVSMMYTHANTLSCYVASGLIFLVFFVFAFAERFRHHAR